MVQEERHVSTAATHRRRRLRSIYYADMLYFYARRERAE